MQALSSAGYRRVPIMAIIDNIIPYIEGEEWKVENEGLKILGKLSGNHVEYADIKISATTRVPTLYGHLELVHVEMKYKPKSLDEVVDAMRKFEGIPQKLKLLPSAPEEPVLVISDPDRPQPRLDRNAGIEMAVVVGRISWTLNIGDNWVKYVVLGHNLVRGASGNTILIAEAMYGLGVD